MNHGSSTGWPCASVRTSAWNASAARSRFPRPASRSGASAVADRDAVRAGHGRPRAVSQIARDTGRAADDTRVRSRAAHAAVARARDVAYPGAGAGDDALRSDLGQAHPRTGASDCAVGAADELAVAGSRALKIAGVETLEVTVARGRADAGSPGALELSRRGGARHGERHDRHTRQGEADRRATVACPLLRIVFHAGDRRTELRRGEEIVVHSIHERAVDEVLEVPEES